MKSKVVLFSLACATALSANIIKSIEYENLSKVSPKIVNEILDLKVGDELNNEQLNKAIKKFYDFGYFDDITVFDQNGNITFKFKEKPSIAKIEINNYKQREDDIKNLKSLMKISKGSMYTPKRIQSAKEALLKLLESEGYINSVVEVETEKLNEHSMKVTFNVNKGDEIIIKKANYYGAKELTRSDFDNVTANKEKEFASWWFGQNSGELKIDQLEYESRRINELYFENGYLDAQVKDPFMKIDFASNQASLDFFIEEGKKYITNSIRIYLDSSIVDPQTIYPELDLIIGNTFNIKKLRRDQKYIKEQVANKGYAFADVKFDIKKNEDSSVDIIYNVIPNDKVYINDVLISGNARTLDRVVRRNIYLAPGDLFNLTDFNDSKAKLNRSGFFENVKIEQRRVSKDKVDILVEVVEGSTGSLTLGGGYGSSEKLMISGTIKDKNVFGSGLDVGLSADLSATKSKFALSLTNPAINDSEYNGSFEIHNSNSEINRSTYDLDKDTKGFSASIGKQIIRNMYAGARYRLDFVKENFTYDDKTKEGDPKYFQDSDYVTSSITPYLNFNNTDSYQLPREGIKFSSSLEFAGIGGDSKYVKSSSSFKYFYSIEDLTELDWIFRYRTRLSAIFDTGQINQGDSLYLGGARSLRGYDSNAFGPNNDEGVVEDPYKRLWSNSLEMSFPLIPNANMRWALFYDYGMTGRDDFTQIKRSSYGAVIEWVSPVGPLQLIFANPIDNKPGDDTSSFEFSLGTSF